MTKHLIELVIEDHEALKGQLNDVRKAAGATRVELLHALVHSLVAHELAELFVVLPRLSERVASGDDLSSARRDEEGYIEAILEELGRVDANSEQGDKLLRRLQGAVLRHHQIEERDVLPRLRAACDTDDLERFGRDFEHVKEVAASSGRARMGATHVTRPVASLVDQAHEAIQAGVRRHRRLRGDADGTVELEREAGAPVRPHQGGPAPAWVRVQ